MLLAAHNEERSIRATLRSVTGQSRVPDLVVVALDNCTDRTEELVRQVPGVEAFRTEGNGAKKPGALNQAWHRYCQDADLLVCIDADTILGPSAVRDWEAEFVENPNLGGCSAKFTMLVQGGMSFFEKFLVRLQRAEFAKWTDLALRRGRRTNVLAGTACCLRNDALRELCAWRAASGSGDVPNPWLETSVVEDFELTYRLRELGWETKVSATVRAYTDAMTDLRSLWAQRMKWQTGTVDDLCLFGVNRLTLFDWWQQVQGMVAIFVRLAWIVLTVAAVSFGNLTFHPLWLIPPALFLASDVRQSFRIPHCEPADVVMAALLLPQEAFAFMRAGWFLASWGQKLAGDAWHSFDDALGLERPQRRDRWAAQASAEKNRASGYGALADPRALTAS